MALFGATSHEGLVVCAAPAKMEAEGGYVGDDDNDNVVGAKLFDNGLHWEI